jgi:HEAT repeat protein
MAVFFCPRCWSEVSEAAGHYPTCGADLAALDAEGFRAKLIRALWHREPVTALRAADLLGRLRAADAVPALLKRYRSGVDPYFAATIARALVEIGGEEARAALDVLARDPSIVVRRATRVEGN